MKARFHGRLGQKHGQQTIDADHLEALSEAIKRAYKRYKLPDPTQVVSYYEEGRDEFWIHLHLETLGI